MASSTPPPVFVKRRPGAPASYFRAEAAGLAWLGEATTGGGCPVAEVLEAGADRLVLARVERGRATAAAAERFGRRLAATHAAGAPSFGAPPPLAVAGPHPLTAGWIADLPLPYDTSLDAAAHDTRQTRTSAAAPGACGANASDPRASDARAPQARGSRTAADDRATGGPWTSFGAFYAAARVAPYVRMARDRGGLDRDEAAVLNRLCARLADDAGDLVGPPEPPARLHGDLWSGNVLWSAAGEAVLVDPAAHGGHRETDLAMLALFGLPFLDRVLAAYDEAAPLAAEWQRRVPLHQVHPLLVHAALFGGSYGAAAVAAARPFL